MSTKIKFDRHSIKFRLWVYFIGIGIGLLLLVWFLQIFFLNNYYEHMKTAEVTRVASSISHAYAREDAGLTEAIQDLSISNDFYVMMESGGKVLLFMPEAESLLPVYQYRDQLPKLRSMLQNASPKTTAVSFKINTGLEKYNTLAYATYLNRAEGQEVYLYIFSPLYPVTSTVEILKDQLFYVTIITLCVTFLLAVYFSDRISKPIKDITQTARKMGKGNYNVKFEANSYSEINNLAKTLNVAAYELGQADNRQKDLVANVSHDLKTPITVICGYTRAIADGKVPQEKLATYLQLIDDKAEELNELLNSFYEYNKVNHPEFRVEPVVADACEFLREYLARHYDEIALAGFTLQAAIPEKMILCAIDQPMMTRALNNIIYNAMKYNALGTVMGVKIVETEEKNKPNTIAIRLADNGVGIAPERRARIFEPFVTGTDSRSSEGSGLGLAITKKIIEAHGGTITLLDKPSPGFSTEFEILLPAVM